MYNDSKLSGLSGTMAVKTERERERGGGDRERERLMPVLKTKLLLPGGFFLPYVNWHECITLFLSISVLTYEWLTHYHSVTHEVYFKHPNLLGRGDAVPS